MKIYFGTYFLLFCMAIYSCHSTSDKKNSVEPNQEVQPDIFVTSLKKQIQQHPDSVLLVEQLLQWYRENNRYNEAILLADSMTRTNEKNFAFHSILGVLFYEVNDTPNAIKHFEEAVRFKPKISDWLSLGSLYAGSKNEKALDIADYIEKSIPESHRKEAFFIRGTYHEAMREFQQAILLFDSCIQQEFSFMEAYREKAICLIELKKYKDALSVLDRATTLNNRFADGHFWKGVCLEKLSQQENAIESYQNALLFDSTYAEAKDALDRIQAK